MPHLHSKYNLIPLFVLLAFVLTPTKVVQAATGDYTDRCDELENLTWEGAPSPLAIICPMVRALNVLVLSAAAIFVILILVTSIKYSMAQGDPKAMQASKQTLTAAVIGFLVVIGVYTILTIIKNVLGLRDNPIADPFGVLSKNFADLLEKFGITNY